MNDNDGFSQLMRVEEYLEQMARQAGNAMFFSGNDGSLYYWYYDGLEVVSGILDAVPLEVVR